jgi:tetratricopeptide (TPR) repeat protein
MKTFCFGPQLFKVGRGACALVMALFILYFAGRADSQEGAYSAVIEGTVRNSQGAPAQAAIVRLRSKEGTQNLTTQTDGKGSYRFSALHGGGYILHVEMKGFTDTVSDVIVLLPNEKKTVNLTVDAVKAEEGSGATKSAPDFFDEPHFTVAGVTDTTNLGGHGSDVVVRTRESLSKDTNSLRGGITAGSPSDAAGYEKERLKIQALLAHSESAELHHSLADLDEKLGDPVDAAHEYERAAVLRPNEVNLFDWGSELLLHHAPEPALEVFQKGNQLFPQSVRMLLGMGAALYAHGSFDAAVHRICEASDLEPGNPTPYLFLGRMQKAEIQSSPELVGKLERFVKLHPEDALASYYCAVGIWKLRKSPEDVAANARVESLLANAIRLNPKLGDAYLQLGILYSEQKALSKAIVAYQQAVQFTPDAEDAHYRLAQAYRQNGQPDKAKTEMRIYDQLVKESAENNERERHEIQQFVYTLRDQPSTLPAK